MIYRNFRVQQCFQRSFFFENFSKNNAKRDDFSVSTVYMKFPRKSKCLPFVGYQNKSHLLEKRCNNGRQFYPNFFTNSYFLLIGNLCIIVFNIQLESKFYNCGRLVDIGYLNVSLGIGDFSGRINGYCSKVLFFYISNLIFLNLRNKNIKFLEIFSNLKLH